MRRCAPPGPAGRSGAGCPRFWAGGIGCRAVAPLTGGVVRLRAPPTGGGLGVSGVRLEISYMVVSPYKAGGGLRRARGRRGWHAGCSVREVAGAIGPNRAIRRARSAPKAESLRGARGGQKGWRTATRSQWHFRAWHVRRGGHRIAIRDHRQVRVLAEHRAIQQAVGRAHGNRVQCGEECCAAPCGGVHCAALSHLPSAIVLGVRGSVCDECVRAEQCVRAPSATDVCAAAATSSARSAIARMARTCVAVGKLS